MRQVLPIILSGLFALPVQADHDADRRQASQARMAVWREARFGMFVHWGPYSVAAGEHQARKIPMLGEWIMKNAAIPRDEYRKIAADFKAENYDPSQWVSFARKCGARYMVVTAKHHDGFALFDSKVSDWDAVEASGAKRDLLRPLVEECRKQGMPLGFHYSQAQDWFHPGGGTYGKTWDSSQTGDFGAYFDKIAVPQLRELFKDYGPVFSVFFDTPVQMNQERAQAILNILPAGTVINDRIGGSNEADYRCAEGSLPPTMRQDGDWELCMTMNGTWGFKGEPTTWAPKENLLKTLILTASRGGNFLLNVGPMADGRFPPQAIERFEYIGNWLARNGEAIYGTSSSPVPTLPWQGACTMKRTKEGGTDLYLHVFAVPEPGVLELPGLTNGDVSAELLANRQRLAVARSGNSWRITLPREAATMAFPVVCLHLAGPPAFEKPALTFDRQGGLTAGATTATLRGKRISLERRPDSPDITIGFWTDPADTVSWTVLSPQPAKVATRWRVACEPASAGAEIAVMLGDNELGRWRVPDTGDWGDFRTVPGPTLDLPAGTFELRLVALSKPGLGVANLHSVSLSPL